MLTLGTVPQDFDDFVSSEVGLPDGKPLPRAAAFHLHSDTGF